MDDDCHRCSGPRTIRSQRHRKSSGLRFLRHDSRIPWHVHSTGRRLIRDIFIGDVPMIIRDKHLYAVPSFIGCILTVLVWRGVSYGWFDMRSEMLLDVLIVIIVVALRLLSVGFNVTLPGAVERHRVYLPSESRYLKRPVIHPHADTVDPGDTTKDEEDKPQDGSRPPQG